MIKVVDETLTVEYAEGQKARESGVEMDDCPYPTNHSLQNYNNLIHQKAAKFVQVVENALSIAYNKDDNDKQWSRIHSWYNDRYLNPDSPEKHNLQMYGDK